MCFLDVTNKYSVGDVRTAADRPSRSLPATVLMAWWTWWFRRQEGHICRSEPAGFSGRVSFSSSAMSASSALPSGTYRRHRGLSCLSSLSSFSLTSEAKTGRPSFPLRHTQSCLCRQVYAKPCRFLSFEF